MRAIELGAPDQGGRRHGSRGDGARPGRATCTSTSRRSSSPASRRGWRSSGGARRTARGWPPSARPASSSRRVHDRRHGPAGDGPGRAVRHHPETGVRVVGLVGSAREARAAGLGDLWLANYADADGVLGRGRRRRRRAVLQRHQPGAARRADPRRAGARSRPVPRPGPVGHRLPPRPGAADRPPAAAVRRVAVAVAAADRLKRAFDVVVSAVLVVVAAPLLAVDRRRHQARRPRSGAVPPAACRAATASSSGSSSSARCASTPRRGWPRCGRQQRAHGPAVQARRRRPAGDARRAVPAGDEPRRAAAAAQRAARRHEPRRPAAGAAVRGRRVPRRAAGPPPGAPRHHRPVAGRGAGQPVVRGLPPPRPVLRRELVAGPRPDHPARHGRAGARCARFLGRRGAASAASCRRRVALAVARRERH